MHLYIYIWLRVKYVLYLLSFCCEYVFVQCIFYLKLYLIILFYFHSNQTIIKHVQYIVRWLNMFV